MSKLEEKIAERDKHRSVFISGAAQIKKLAAELQTAQETTRLAKSRMVEANAIIHKLLDADMAGVLGSPSTANGDSTNDVASEAAPIS